MNTACPTCRTEYAVTAADVGRRVACAKCGTHLLVAQTGLKVEPAAAGRETTASLPRLRVPEDWPTLTFACGSVLVLLFVLLPLIQSAGVERRTALLTEATLEHAAAVKRLRERNADGKATADAEEAWQRRREQLQDDVKLAEAARARDLYWSRFGLLFASLVLAVGAIGWTRPDQPLTRRTVGAVVLAAMLLLALQTVLPLGCSPPARSYNSGANTSP